MVQTQNEFYGVGEEDNSKNHTQSKCKWYRLKMSFMGLAKKTIAKTIHNLSVNGTDSKMSLGSALVNFITLFLNIINNV